MIAQIFILPWFDSIPGFTVLFLVISFAASWLITSGPRLSYFGDRFALAYSLINFSEFTIQTSPTPARDRVVGVLLGLSSMWLVFDQLWGAPANWDATPPSVMAQAQCSTPWLTMKQLC